MNIERERKGHQVATHNEITAEAAQGAHAHHRSGGEDSHRRVPPTKLQATITYTYKLQATSTQRPTNDSLIVAVITINCDSNIYIFTFY